jgi:hypothetical protein
MSKAEPPPDIRHTTVVLTGAVQQLQDFQRAGNARSSGTGWLAPECEFFQRQAVSVLTTSTPAAIRSLSRSSRALAMGATACRRRHQDAFAGV